MAASPFVDVSKIGKPPISSRPKRRHVRSLTGNHHLHILYFEPILIPTYFPQATSLRWTRRVKKNGPGVTSRVGKLPCVAFTQVLPLPACIVHRATKLTADVPEITKAVVNHIQTSLGRAPYNIDDFGAYQAAALSVRDNLIVSPWSHYLRIGLSQDRGSNLYLIDCQHLLSNVYFCSVPDPVVSLT
jgi:hypothetical protein